MSTSALADLSHAQGWSLVFKEKGDAPYKGGAGQDEATVSEHEGSSASVYSSYAEQ